MVDDGAELIQFERLLDETVEALLGDFFWIDVARKSDDGNVGAMSRMALSKAVPSMCGIRVSVMTG